jgi:hypothetical protein
LETSRCYQWSEVKIEIQLQLVHGDAAKGTLGAKSINTRWDFWPSAAIAAETRGALGSGSVQLNGTLPSWRSVCYAAVIGLAGTSVPKKLWPSKDCITEMKLSIN